MLLSAFLTAPFFSPDSAIAAPPPTEPMTLMGTLADWKYPGSKMLGGASMSDGGNPSVPDGQMPGDFDHARPDRQGYRLLFETGQHAPGCRQAGR